MMVKSFPRGGRKPQKISQANELFDGKYRSQKKNSKKNKTNKKHGMTDNAEKFLATTAECLKYETLTQGMVVLGRVRESTEYHLIISLPGRIIGRLQLTDISGDYTKILQNMIDSQDSAPDGYKTLPELYKPGDYLVCYVKQVQMNEKWKVILSLEPNLINQNLDPARLAKASKVVGIIASVEEHGYIIDTGVTNLRTFLPSKDIDDGKEYFIGQQVLLAVKNMTTADSTSIATVSAKAKHNAKAVEQEAQELDALVPGTKLFLTITRILKDGLEVSFNNDNVGYVNQIYLRNALSSFTEDTVIHGTLLYVLPTVKFGYFSLLAKEAEKETLNVGDIITNAKVVCREPKGILLQLPKNLRGFLPVRRTGVHFEKILATFAPNTQHKCRVLNYDWFDRVYICSMEKDVLNDENLTVDTCVPGNVLNATITRVDCAYGSVTLKVPGGKNGYIPPEHVSDIGKKIITKLKVGETLDVRVLNYDTDRNRVVCTVKESLLKSNLPILKDIDEAVVGSAHHGTIVKIGKTGLLVQFFGNVKGWVPSNMSGCQPSETRKQFSIGQVVSATIIAVDKSEMKIKLSLIGTIADTSINFRVGEVVEGTVTESSSQGIEVALHSEESKNSVSGFLPAGHMAPSLEVGSLLAARYTIGDKISATVFSTKPSILLTTTLGPMTELLHFHDLKYKDQITCSVKEISKNTVKVLLPLQNYGKLVPVVFPEPDAIPSYHIHQILYAKVMSKMDSTRKLELTTDLYELWWDAVKENADMTNAVDTLTLYLHKLAELSRYQYYASRPISKAKLGQRVSGKVEKITEHGLVLQLENDLQGIVRKEHYQGKLKVGDEVSGAVIWINYIHELVEVTLKPHIIESTSSEQTSLEAIPIGTPLRGAILLVTNWFVLVMLKGQARGTLVCLPARRHLNDVDPDLTPYIVGRKVKCYVVVDSSESNILPICLLSSTFETSILSSTTNGKSKKVKRKQSTTPEESTPPKKTKIVEDPEKSVKVNGQTTKKPIVENETGKKKKKQEINDEPIERKKKKKERPTETELDNDVADQSSRQINIKSIDESSEVNELSIRPCGFVWDNIPTPENLNQIESSSDSDEDTEGPQKKKKKLSATERREQERQKEREIREKEEALASNQLPNSVDQFDRLVMSSPDSSVVWIQYMAYHLQATEVEKARAVAKRAMKTINFREENEKLNVSQAWLNLESRFGTPESLNEVFQESIKVNDAFKIYTHMLTLHAEANRQTALEKTVTTITGKFKENPQAWTESGAALLKMGLKDKSRHVMQRALQSLPLHQHVDLIVRFAQLENRFGDKERAQTLFEQILSSYPKRVDVWSSYVDALIKSGDITIARQILERASAQTLPARKMKTIFKKFIAFEEQHGTPENVAKVQQMARTYVENQCQDR